MQSSHKIEGAALSTAQNSHEVPEQLNHGPASSSSTISSAVQTGLVEATSFLSPIHTLPSELLVEIFHWILLGSPPRRKLATVCRRWKEILLQTPTLWTELEVCYRYEGEQTYESRRLQRRIELSQSTLLDVKINISQDWETKYGVELFEMVLDTGPDRWRKLTIQCWGERSNCGDELVHKLVGKRLSALQYLSITCHFWSNKFVSAIGELLIQSKPKIENLTIIGNLFGPYTDAHVFKYVKFLSVQISSMRQLRGFSSLQEIDVWGYGDPDPASFPPLPSRASFAVLNRRSLATLQVTHLRHLEINKWSGYFGHTVIELPILISLTFGDGSLGNVRNILAPKLQTLKIMGASGDNKSQQHKEITDLFTTAPPVLFVRPTDLTLWTTMSVETLIFILKSWPQMQHLTFIFDYARVDHGFFHLFLRPEPLCLNLINLRLDAKAWDFIKNKDELEWIERGIFQLRENLPLELIAWREPTKPDIWHEMRRNGSGNVLI